MTICYRINAVQFCDEEWIITEIAEALFLSEEAIRQHIRDFLKSRKLKSENAGSQEQLSSEQAQDLEKHLLSSYSPNLDQKSILVIW